MLLAVSKEAAFFVNIIVLYLQLIKIFIDVIIFTENK